MEVFTFSNSKLLACYVGDRLGLEINGHSYFDELVDRATGMQECPMPSEAIARVRQLMNHCRDFSIEGTLSLASFQQESGVLQIIASNTGFSIVDTFHEKREDSSKCWREAMRLQTKLGLSMTRFSHSEVKWSRVIWNLAVENQKYDLTVLECHSECSIPSESLLKRTLMPLVMCKKDGHVITMTTSSQTRIVERIFKLAGFQRV